MPDQAHDGAPAFSRTWRSEAKVHPGDAFQTSRTKRLGSHPNWPLWLGSLIVMLVLLAAVAGPSLAPRDPLEENAIIQVGENWETPPFSPLTVPGFPLGSDQFGRDLFSRLLWAVRPSMAMVAIVSAVRLVLGTIIGLGAGWFTNRFGQLLESAIGAALAVPVLMIALGAIAILGVELGLLAFIVGLSINGWVETARIVREQTQLIKGNLYIEAARALGASNEHILLRHVLRQLMPMTWMLCAFEISSTLMTTAGLGFLGYYIGGEVWTDVGDFVARRLSGMPELGQMLATAWNEQQVITEPWAMIVAGSVVFIAVLGFNLLGEGLRLRLRLDQVHRRTTLRMLTDRVGSWMEARGVSRTVERAKESATRPLIPGIPVSLASGSMVVLLMVGGLFWWRARSAEDTTTGNANPTIADLNGHLWMAERHDPQGTLWTPASGPAEPIIQWVFQDPTGFTGGPAVAADGTIYLGGASGALFALDPSGSVLWQAALPDSAVGSPALDADGQIYVTDQSGTLSAFSSDGDRIWRFQPSNSATATTGPVVALNGTIYYPSSGRIHAVSPQGELLWAERVPYGFDPAPPKLNPSGELVFFLDAAYNAEDGSPYDLEALAGKASNEQYVMGADGRTYYRSEHRLLEWRPSPAGLEVVSSFNKQIPGQPRDAGVTQDGTVWGAFLAGFNSPDSGVIWLDQNDQVLGNILFEQARSRIIAVDSNNVVYACGTAVDETVDCTAVAPESDEPVWQIKLEQGSRVVGGALVPGRLYASLAEGFFYTIGALAQDGKLADGLIDQPLIISAPPTTELSTPTVPTTADGSVGGTPAPTARQPAATLTPLPLPSISPGQMLTYTLTVANRGPSTAREVIVTDTLPTGMIFVDGWIGNGDEPRRCSLSPRADGRFSDAVICHLGELAEGASAEITLVVWVHEEATDVVTNTVTVASRDVDPHPSDNRIDRRLSVAAEADLEIRPFDLPDPVAAGDRLTYALAVTNHGPAAAYGVVLTDALPLGVTLLSTETSQGIGCSTEAISSSPGIVNCSLGDLTIHASATVTLVATVDTPMTDVLTNTVSVTSQGTDPVLQNNQIIQRSTVQIDNDPSAIQ